MLEEQFKLIVKMIIKLIGNTMVLLLIISSYTYIADYLWFSVLFHCQRLMLLLLIINILLIFINIYTINYLIISFFVIPYMKIVIGRKLEK